MPIANTTLEIQKVIEAAARAVKIPEGQVVALAEKAVAFFVEMYGGRKLYVPMLQHQRRARNDSIRAALRDGLRPERIASTHDVNVSTVQRIRNAMTDI